MPLYEFECVDCGRFEIFFQKMDDPDFWQCGCKRLAIRVQELCAMQPDTMWAGVKNDQGYFISKSEYNKFLKEKNLETITHRELETVRKNVAKAKKDKKEKQLNNLISHLTNDLKDVTIDPDGNTLKERNKYVRTRNKPE